MERPDRDDERPYYGPARIVGGLGLLLVAAIYLLVVSPLTGKPPDALVLTITTAMGATLLGIEGLTSYLGRR